MNEDFRPTATIETLGKRAEIISRIRTFFDSRGFLHVETPVISRDIVVDRYLDPICVSSAGIAHGNGQADCLYLQTSPEFAMKRLVASGANAIYQIGPVFRSGEAGQIHNPEFTMLEWYRTGQSTARAIEMIGQLVEASIERKGTIGRSYESIFGEYAGVDPHRADASELRATATKHGIEFTGDADEDRDQWLNLILTHVIEPNLGRPDPVVVFDWPASQSALAKVRDGDPPVAERFELYIDGIELANGYNELLDAEELLNRNRQNNRLRDLDGKPVLPEESRLLDAMRSGMPQCCGVALGVDRLVMVALGLDSIRDVIAFPIDRA